MTAILGHVDKNVDPSEHRNGGIDQSGTSTGCAEVSLMARNGRTAAVIFEGVDRLVDIRAQAGYVT